MASATISEVTFQTTPSFVRTGSTPNSLNTLFTKHKRANVAFDKNNFVLESFIHSLQIDKYKKMGPIARTLHLEKVDAIALFSAVQDVARDLYSTKIENHFLTDFLEKNDPKLLIGLVRTRTALELRRSTRASGLSSGNQSSHLMTLSMSRRSMATDAAANASIYSRRGGSLPEYRLNYRAKTDIAEKTASSVEKRINELEAKAKTEIKHLNARLEEHIICSKEAIETSKNFNEHFLETERDLLFLESATEKQLERKFRKFVNTWLKNSRSLLGAMHLRIDALIKTCQQLRNDLITKSDLSGVLGAVDFDLVAIKRAQLAHSLEERNTFMAGLKAITGKASLAMSEEKKILMDLENESKRIQVRTAEVIKATQKLEKESKLIEIENKNDEQILGDLKAQLRIYVAPSVSQYIQKKDKLLALEKEEKMLQRKVSIILMKLTNILNRCKKLT